MEFTKNSVNGKIQNFHQYYFCQEKRRKTWVMDQLNTRINVINTAVMIVARVTGPGYWACQ
jgi:hypothetical protein